MNNYNPNKHHRRSIRLKGYDYSQAELYYITLCTQHWAHLFGEIRNGEMVLNDAGKMVEKWYGELQNKFNDIKCHAMVVMPNHFHCIVENTGSVGTWPIMGGNVGACSLWGEHIGTCRILAEHVGADLCVCPIMTDHVGVCRILGEHVGADLCVCPIMTENVGVCTIMTKNVGVCTIMTKNVGVCTIMTKNVVACPVMGEHVGTCPILGEHVGTCPILGEHVGSPLRDVVRWFKTMTTNHYIRGVKQNNWPPFDGKIWQRNYYEHIIRNDESYQRISDYIINNPANWDTDKLNS